jgi:ABC-type Na+ efflux pump permease subunit
MIYWKETIWVNALRLLSATMVWLVFAGVTGYEDTLSLIGLPIFYVFLAIVVMAARSVAPNNAFVGFLSLMALITILPGDPLVFLLRTIVPKAVPFHRYYPFNWAFFLYVTDSTSSVPTR